MDPPLDPGEVERFRSVVTHRLGLQFEDAKLGFLADVLERRLAMNGHMCPAYLTRLEAQPSREEIGALAQELTVAETYFFRNSDQFHAFSEFVLPERLRAQAARKRLHILSAGCASGEEAYSIAMLMRDLVKDPAWDISILAVDLNPAMLEKARRARFSEWALRETPPEMRQRWFRPDGREFVLDERLREAVTFEERNLVDDDAGLWQAGSYDVVFCRNVVMYFAPEIAQSVIAHIARALAPGGYLFLGHAETLRGLSQDYHLRHTHGTFYYQRKDSAGSVRADTFAEHGPSRAAAPTLAAVIDTADTWVDAIHQAAERIEVLTRPAATPIATPRRTAAHWELGLALDLLRKEQFTAALELIQALPPESARDPDVLLLHAVLLAHSGAFANAEQVCLRLLAIDEMSAGAHYVLALCRESTGDRRGAADHDQVASYLDPAFAMPHLHLGLLARRSGDREGVRRELGKALVLLQREDASRLLLFGGGFNRDTLTALCRTELNAHGGRA